MQRSQVRYPHLPHKRWPAEVIPRCAQVWTSAFRFSWVHYAEVERFVPATRATYNLGSLQVWFSQEAWCFQPNSDRNLRLSRKRIANWTAINPGLGSFFHHCRKWPQFRSQEFVRYYFWLILSSMPKWVRIWTISWTQKGSICMCNFHTLVLECVLSRYLN